MTTEMTVSEIVAMRVRGLMAEHNLKGVGLASLLGISQSAASERVRGIKPFPLDELAILSHKFGVSFAYLVGETDVRESTNAARTLAGAGRRFLLPELDSNQQPSDSRFRGVTCGVATKNSLRLAA